MAISNIQSSTTAQIPSKISNNSSSVVPKQTESKSENIENSGVIYTKSSENTSTKKSSSNYDADTINKLKEEVAQRTQSLRNLVESMIKKQGDTANNTSVNLNETSTTNIETKKIEPSEISEDGYWGVKQTSERILKFATSLSGSDSSNISKLRDAFKEGFEDAKKAFGGKLPDISQKTYDAVMEGFDKWEKEGVSPVSD